MISNLRRTLSSLALLITTLSVYSPYVKSPDLADETPFSGARSLSYEILNVLPHSTRHFTQGLFFHEEKLYESIGHYGQSALLRYSADMESIPLNRALSAKYFAEGATIHKGVIYQLTWRAGEAFAYLPKRLTKQEGFTYEGQGWGLTSDNEHLWMSDGSDQLKRIDTQGNILSTVNVTHNGNPLNRLNELEWVNGKIFANRWYDQRIYVINPTTGKVTHSLNLAALAQPELARSREHVLNGIAWQPETQTLWITGKNWQSLYELKIEAFE